MSQALVALAIKSESRAVCTLFTDSAQMHSATLSSHSLESANRIRGRSLLSSHNGNQLSCGGMYPSASHWTLFYTIEVKIEGFKLLNEKMKCFLHLFDQIVKSFKDVKSHAFIKHFIS